MAPEVGEDLVNLATAAQLTGLSRATISRAVNRGDIGVTVRGKQRRFDPEELLRYAVRSVSTSSRDARRAATVPSSMRNIDQAAFVRDVLAADGVFVLWPGSEGEPAPTAARARWLINNGKLLEPLKGAVEVASLRGGVCVRYVGPREKPVRPVDSDEGVATREVIAANSSDPALRKVAIRAAHDRGWSYAEIAEMYGGSRQYVQRIASEADPSRLSEVTVPERPSPVGPPDKVASSDPDMDRLIELLGGDAIVDELKSVWNDDSRRDGIWKRMREVVDYYGVQVRTLARAVGIDPDLASNRLRAIAGETRT